MFFFIARTLSFLLAPLIWILILMGFGIFTRSEKKRKRLLLISFFTFLFFSNSFVVDELLLIWEVPATPDQQLGHYDAGIVLSGGMVDYDTGLRRLAFRENTDRILQAVDLYKSGVIEKIIISGGSGSLIYRDMKESVILKNYFTHIGIADSVIIIDSVSDNTRQNALMTREIIDRSFSGGKFLLITSAIHMRRARACFFHESIYTYPYSTNRFTGKRRWDASSILIPDVSAFERWDKLLHELCGYIIYDIMGYL